MTLFSLSCKFHEKNYVIRHNTDKDSSFKTTFRYLFCLDNILLKIQNKVATVTHIILFVCFRGDHVHNEALLKAVSSCVSSIHYFIAEIFISYCPDDIPKTRHDFKVDPRKIRDDLEQNGFKW